ALPTQSSDKAVAPSGNVASRVKAHRKTRPVLIAEAKESLLTVLALEQVYFQRHLVFFSVVDTAEIRRTSGADLSEPGRRWAFSATDLSFTGFVAIAEGRPGT